MWVHVLKRCISKAGIDDAALKSFLPAAVILLGLVCFLVLYAGVKSGGFYMHMYFCYGITTILMIISIWYSMGFIKAVYSVEPEDIGEIVDINQYFREQDQPINVLCLESSDGVDGSSRLIDTYIDIKGNLITVDDNLLDNYAPGSIKVGDITFCEAIWGQQYGNFDHIDYIIVERSFLNANKQFSNCKRIKKLGGRNFYVLKNKEPKELSIEEAVVNG